MRFQYLKKSQFISLTVTLILAGCAQSGDSPYMRDDVSPGSVRNHPYDLAFCAGNGMYRVSFDQDSIFKIKKTDLPINYPKDDRMLVFGVHGPGNNLVSYNMFTWPPRQMIKSPLSICDIAQQSTRVVSQKSSKNGITPAHPSSLATSPDMMEVMAGCVDGCYKIGLDGIATRLIPHRGSYVSYAPGGKAVVFGTEYGVFVLSATDHHIMARLAAGRMPTWLSESELICYAGRFRGELPAPAFSLYNINTRESRQLGRGFNAKAVPHLRAVIFDNNKIMQVSNPSNIKYLFRQVNHIGLSVSPDGRFYVFRDDHHPFLYPVPTRSRLRIAVLDETLLAKMDKRGKLLRPRIIDVYKWPKDGEEFTTMSWVEASR
jgi:hypothetical protein